MIKNIIKTTLVLILVLVVKGLRFMSVWSRHLDPFVCNFRFISRSDYSYFEWNVKHQDLQMFSLKLSRNVNFSPKVVFRGSRHSLKLVAEHGWLGGNRVQSLIRLFGPIFTKRYDIPTQCLVQPPSPPPLPILEILPWSNETDDSAYNKCTASPRVFMANLKTMQNI